MKITKRVKKIIKWFIIAVIFYMVVYSLNQTLLLFIGAELGVDQLNGGNFEAGAYSIWDNLMRGLWYLTAVPFLYAMYLTVVEVYIYALEEE